MSDKVRINVPDPSCSLLITPSGEPVEVHIEGDGRRWAEVKREDAAVIVHSGDRSRIAWRLANEDLLKVLPAPQQEPGVLLARQWARERDARAPQSLAEATKQTLAMYRRGFR